MKYIAGKFLHLMLLDREKYFHQKYSAGELDLLPCKLRETVIKPLVKHCPQLSLPVNITR